MQMAPPKWAKAATDLSKASGKWPWLFDDSEAGKNLQHHLVWLLPTLLATVGLHLLFLKVAASMSWTVPGMLKYPKFEVTVYLCAAMGMLDNGSAVLTAPECSYGWKFIALLEIGAALVFIFRLFKAGQDFQRRHGFRHNINAPQLKPFVSIGNAKDPHCKLGKSDVVGDCRKLGLAPGEAAALFEELDLEQCGVLDRDAFLAGFRKRPVNFNRAGLYEQVIILLFYGRRQSGSYLVESADDDNDEGLLDWFFLGFTPAHNSCEWQLRVRARKEQERESQDEHSQYNSSQPSTKTN